MNARIITLSDVNPAARLYCDGEMMVPYREHKAVCDALEEWKERAIKAEQLPDVSRERGEWEARAYKAEQSLQKAETELFCAKHNAEARLRGLPPGSAAALVEACRLIVGATPEVSEREEVLEALAIVSVPSVTGMSCSVVAKTPEGALLKLIRWVIANHLLDAEV